MIAKKNSKGGGVLLNSPAADSKETAMMAQAPLGVAANDVVVCSGTSLAGSDFPRPQALEDMNPFFWNEDAPPVDNYVDLGQRLAESRPSHQSSQISQDFLQKARAPSGAFSLATQAAFRSVSFE